MNSKTSLILIAAFEMAFSGCTVSPPPSEAHPTPSDALPSPFTDFCILTGSESPNGQFGVIYPKRDKIFEASDRGADRLALVRLSPFRVLCDIPRGHSSLTVGHGSYSFSWTPDSSAFLMVQGIRWGPDRVYLGELSTPTNPVLTDLAAHVAERLRPAFKASMMPRYNDNFDFIFDLEDRDSTTGGWEFTNAGDVSIDCTCTNNPKPLDLSTWKIRWQGVWKRSERRLVQRSLIQDPQTIR